MTSALIADATEDLVLHAARTIAERHGTATPLLDTRVIMGLLRGQATIHDVAAAFRRLRTRGVIVATEDGAPLDDELRRYAIAGIGAPPANRPPQNTSRVPSPRQGPPQQAGAAAQAGAPKPAPAGMAGDPATAPTPTGLRSYSCRSCEATTSWAHVRRTGDCPDCRTEQRRQRDAAAVARRKAKAAALKKAEAMQQDRLAASSWGRR